LGRSRWLDGDVFLPWPGNEQPFEPSSHGATTITRLGLAGEQFVFARNSTVRLLDQTQATDRSRLTPRRRYLHRLAGGGLPSEIRTA
jgi:hypothetical protein